MARRMVVKGVMRPGREANNLPASNTEVKSEWSYSFTLLYAFTMCTGANYLFYLLCWNANRNSVGEMWGGDTGRSTVVITSSCVGDFEAHCIVSSSIVQVKSREKMNTLYMTL
jgi:hypothetical protein